MSHMVIFRTPEGKPGYQPAETVEDAVEVVERLRNDDGVENVRIFRLEELSFEYRPYYKVELAGAGQQTGDAPSAAASFAPALGEESTDVFADADPAGEPDVEDDAEHSTEAEASDESPQEPVAEHPPWAAPPPPPPPPPGAEPPFGTRPAEGDADDDEFSGAGQRRGLFGR